MSFGGNGSIVASANMKKVKRHDASAHSASYTLDDRLVVRDQFNLSPEYIHLATFARFASSTCSRGDSESTAVQVGSF
jgi:hypothetical protein